MATRTIIVVTGDLDHSTDNVAAHRFALDGVEYEIDLAPHNLERMRQALAPYIAAGRRLPKRTAGRRRGTDGVVRDVRAAHEQPPQLPRHRSHGPTSEAVRDAYRAAAHPAPGQEAR